MYSIDPVNAYKSVYEPSGYFCDRISPIHRPVHVFTNTLVMYIFYTRCAVQSSLKATKQEVISVAPSDLDFFIFRHLESPFFE